MRAFVKSVLAAGIATVLAVTAQAAELWTPRQAAEAVDGGKAVLVDIRTPPEWKETGVAASATPIDMTAQDFVPKLKQVLAENPGKTVAFICRTGNRSSHLVGLLEKAGLTNIADVTGGMAGKGAQKGWIAEGLPLRPGCTNC